MSIQEEIKMRVKGILLLILILTSSIGLPLSNGMTIEMQESGENALLGFLFLFAFTASNSTKIYETPELTITYTHLDLAYYDVFVIETAHHNVSSVLDFYVIKDGIATKFGVIGINVSPVFIWLEFPDQNMTWRHFEFPIQEAEG